MRPATRAARGAAVAAPALPVPAVSATYRCLTPGWAIMNTAVIVHVALDGLPAAWRSWLQVPTDAQNDRATSPPQNTNCKQRWLNQYRPRSFSTKPTTTTKPTI